MDLKSFSNKFYQKRCKATLEPVIRNLKEIKKKDIWLEVITLIIPDENDTREEIKSIAEFIKEKLGAETPWHLSRFRPAYKMKNKTPTNPAKIEQAYRLGKEAGLKHVYAGNIKLPKLTDTYCPNCEEVVIERTGFRSRVLAENGKCPKCGEGIAGTWE